MVQYLGWELDNMKISKEQLKSIVKECLVEILTEGLGPNKVTSTSYLQKNQLESKQINYPKKKSTQFDPRLDTPISTYRDVIKKEAGGNQILESIFADTVKNTLSSHANYRDPGEGYQTTNSKIAQQEQFVGTPEQVFGEESASKWASLAFMDSTKNKKA